MESEPLERSRVNVDDDLLVQLHRSTRGLLDPQSVLWEFVRRTGEHFGVSRCLFAEIDAAQEYAVVQRDYTNGVISGVGRHRMELFGPPLISEMKAGQTVVIRDAHADPRTQGPMAQMSFAALQIRSAVAVNLLEDGRLVASMQVQHAAPRQWSAQEVRLLEQVAERSWFALEAAHATAELRESRNVLALAMRGGQMGVWSRRFPDGVWWSLELCEIHGIPPEEAPKTEEESLRYVHPDDRANLIRSLHDDVLARRDHRSECRFRHGSGQWRWLEVRARAVHDAEGRPVMVHGIAVDISARKQAELELRERESRYRSLVEASGAIVFTSDAQANWLEPNPAWEAYTGQTFAQYRGHGWATAIHADDLEQVQRNVQRSLQAGTTWSDVARLWHAPTATYRYQEARVVPIRSGDGQITAWIGTVLDVHARQQAESALRAADRRKDEFIATLAHELRNPLAPISNALGVLERAGGSPQTAAVCREIMTRQVGQMTRLIDDLMDVSRINSGRVTLRKAPMSLRKCILEAVEAVRPSIEQRRQSLEVELGSQDIWTDGDSARLAQVFSNLLGNASKFTPEAGAIRVTLHDSDGCAVVSVVDSGIGIPHEMLEGVFEMFSQVDHGLAKAHQGLGVGLTISRQLVHLHGGAIRAFSEGPARGSRFEVRLRVTASAGVIAAPAAAGFAPARRRILVVDDNRDSADTLVTMLTAVGHGARPAYDGPSALAVGDAFRPDVVLLDIGMPGMPGYAVAKLMRERPWGENCVLVALTGWGQPADKMRAAEAGFDGHLVKPLELAAFEGLLAQARDRRPEVAIGWCSAGT